MTIEVEGAPTGPLLNGYRKLSEEELRLANEVKTMGSYVELLIDRLAARPDIDKRWVAIARTELQQGFMALTRAVTKPTSF